MPQIISKIKDDDSIQTKDDDSISRKSSEIFLLLILYSNKWFPLKKPDKYKKS